MKPGGETVITRLADILIIQALRSWLEQAPAAQKGWLAALRDEQIGRALIAIHRAPERDWNIVRLAHIAGMPVETFIQTGSQTPIAYLLQPFTDYFNRAFREN